MKKLRTLSFEEAKEEQRTYFLSLSYAERIAELEKLRRKILGPSPVVRSKKIEIIPYNGKSWNLQHKDLADAEELMKSQTNQ